MSLRIGSVQLGRTKWGGLAIDLINGSELLRRWFDDPRSTPLDPDKVAVADEVACRRERRAFLL